MELTVKILLVLVSLAFMLWPFLPKKEGEEEAVAFFDVPLHKLLQQKEITYAAIKELDFDYNMGKLSEEDYRQLTQQYKQKAVEILGSIDKLEKSAVKGNACA